MEICYYVCIIILLNTFKNNQNYGKFIHTLLRNSGRGNGK